MNHEGGCKPEIVKQNVVWIQLNTINARISVQLQISALLRISAPPKTQNLYKRPLQIIAPLPPPRKNEFGTRYNIRGVHGLYGSFNEM